MERTITDFAEAVRTETIKKLGGEYQVTVETKNKNNKAVYTGLHISRKGMEAEPLVYLDDYFRQYQNGNMTVPEAAECVARASRKKGPSVEIRQFLEYENVKDSIVYRLINTEMNRELLDDLPHMEFLDLSVVFCCLVMEEEDNPAFIWIHNIHMKLWDVTVEELYWAASENTQRLEKPELMNIEEILYDVLPEKGFSLNENDRSMEPKSRIIYTQISPRWFQSLYLRRNHFEYIFIICTQNSNVKAYKVVIKNTTFENLILQNVLIEFKITIFFEKINSRNVLLGFIHKQYRLKCVKLLFIVQKRLFYLSKYYTTFGLWKKKQQEITMRHPLYLCMYSAAENACKERHVCCTRTC